MKNKPKIQNVASKIERYAIGLPHGKTVTSAKVAKDIGGRRIDSKLVASIFKALPEMEHIKDCNGGKWVRR
jgi:hypothetical protein